MKNVALGAVVVVVSAIVMLLAGAVTAWIAIAWALTG